MSLDATREQLAAERELGTGEFHVRWYRHKQGALVGPFATVEELHSYMTRHGLPRPDELLTPFDD